MTFKDMFDMKKNYIEIAKKAFYVEPLPEVDYSFNYLRDVDNVPARIVGID